MRTYTKSDNLDQENSTVATIWAGLIKHTGNLLITSRSGEERGLCGARVCVGDYH